MTPKYPKLSYEYLQHSQESKRVMKKYMHMVYVISICTRVEPRLPVPLVLDNFGEFFFSSRAFEQF
ncbi:MAG: hypothetical protein ACPIOQ_70030, partial [Promethearchaeia archaeon]